MLGGKCHQGTAMAVAGKSIDIQIMIILVLLYIRMSAVSFERIQMETIRASSAAFVAKDLVDHNSSDSSTEGYVQSVCQILPAPHTVGCHLRVKRDMS